MSSPVEPGAAGLVLNPAAALSEGVELLLDAQRIGYTYEYTLYEPLDESSPEAFEDSASFPAPYLAFSVPLSDRVGIGLSAKLPYARIGEGPPDGTARFHSISGKLLMGELESAIAVEVTPSLVIGAGFRSGLASYSSVNAIDTGILMYEILGEEAEDLIGDPFFEGTRSVRDGTSRPKSVSVGFLANFPRATLAGGWRSSSTARFEGEVEMVPSNDLNMSLKGELAGEFVFPSEWFIAVEAPIGPVQAGAELGLIRWGQSSETLIAIVNTSLTTDDPTLSGFMSGYGLDDPTLIGDIQSMGKFGLRDILAGGGWVKGSINEDWAGTLGVWVSPPSVGEAFVHPGNADYWMADLRAALAWNPLGPVKIGLSADWLASKERVIEQSGLDLKNTDPESAGALPSGNGSYDLDMSSVGLSLLFQF
ncbi:MAG: hypothetical protein VX519_02800 [Myxococcota bacterium]|nr:hypothetical protein [Myxococcota bacterium]